MIFSSRIYSLEAAQLRRGPLLLHPAGSAPRGEKVPEESPQGDLPAHEGREEAAGSRHQHVHGEEAPLAVQFICYNNALMKDYVRQILQCPELKAKVGKKIDFKAWERDPYKYIFRVIPPLKADS